MTIFDSHRPRRPGRARAAIALGTIVAAGLLTACGGGDGDDAAAAPPDPSPTTDTESGAGDDSDTDVDGDTADSAATSDVGGSDGASEMSPEEQQLAFAQCLREQGLDVADPTPGQAGLPGIDRGDPEAQAAIDTCRDEVGDVTFGQMGDNMADTGALLDFVDCLREHGIEIGDPGPDGRLPMPENAEPGDREMQGAGQECGHLLQGGGILVGEGGPGAVATQGEGG